LVVVIVLILLLLLFILVLLLLLKNEQMDGEIAWKRSKSVEKEMEGLAVKIKPFLAPPAQSHDEAVDLLVQSLYETLTGFMGKPFPDNWEHAHNQNITCYRLYYQYDVLDPSFPDPVSPRDLVVPSVRPEKPIAPLPPTPPPRAATAITTATYTAEVPPVTTSFHAAAAAATAAPLPEVSSSSESPPNGIGMAALMGGEAAVVRRLLYQEGSPKNVVGSWKKYVPI
jgi:hypothetical protein